MQLSGQTVDPRLRLGFLLEDSRARRTSTTSTPGNSTADRVLNTAGYRFNQTDLNNRDQYGFRVDYALTDSHRFEGVYSYFKEIDDRTDLDFISPDRPLVFTNSDRQAVLAGVALARQLELPERGSRRRQPRAGPVRERLAVPRQPVHDGARHHQPDWRHNSPQRPSASSRRAATRTPIRSTTPRSLMLGTHQLQMGGSWQRNHVNPYNFAGQFPQVNFGFSTAAPGGLPLTSAQFPGGICRGRPRQRQRDGQLARGDCDVGGADVPGAGSELGIRRGHPVERKLHARQHRRLRAGQLALEAELHGPRRA